MTNEKNNDPVLPDQGGRSMTIDPLHPVNNKREDVVRLKAYEIYERRGRETGKAIDHWLAAEQEVTELTVSEVLQKAS